MDEFLTVDDVAQLLKLNPQTVRNWIDQGKLTAVRAGGRRVRVRRVDLDAFIDGGSTVPRPAGGDERGRLASASAAVADAAQTGGDEVLAVALDELADAAIALAAALRRS